MKMAGNARCNGTCFGKQHEFRHATSLYRINSHNPGHQTDLQHYKDTLWKKYLRDTNIQCDTAFG